ncbi:alpha/beta-hydrolase [Xylariomycetidae sp. FL0641]|nr:alpha/beta-hydrolase [Xylariomycetidae sp. FL0641]
MRPVTITTEQQTEPALPLLARFDSYAETYKRVNGQPIDAYILIPKGGPGEKRPLLVRIHGGGFTEGTCDGFIAPWILSLALAHNAVIVAPDYRLLPQASWTDALDDMRSSWGWVSAGLCSLLPEVDLQSTACVGESAGGYLAAQSAQLRLFPRLRALILQYAALHPTAALAALSAENQTPRRVLDEALAEVDAEPDGIATRRPYGSTLPLQLALMQHLGLRFPGVDLADEGNAWLDPVRGLGSCPAAAAEGREEENGGMPPTFLFHGRDDASPAPVAGSEAWAARFREVFPQTPLLFVLRDGGHGCDQGDMLAAPWLREPVEFVERFWPLRSP